MAYIFPDIVNVEPISEQEEKAWEYTETLASPGNGVSIIIPAGCNNISVTLWCDAASSGKVQTSNSLLGTVKAGTSEVWVDWTLGTVSTTSQDSCVPVTAIRHVNVSGTTKIEVRMQ